MSQLPIDPISAFGQLGPMEGAARTIPSAAQSFGRLLLDGVDRVNDSVVKADQLARAYAVDDSVPLHQVTFALEQARLSIELMSQVRARLVEGYQELFRMQL